MSKTGTMGPAVVTPAGVSSELPTLPKGVNPKSAPRHTLPPLPTGTYRPLPKGPETPPPAGANTVGPQAATITVFKNAQVTPTGASRSSIGEPSAAHVGFSSLYTGNWYAAISSNDGSSWTYVNPYTKFKSIDGGFCCDQYAMYIPSYRMVAWLLQYGYSSSTKKNTHRIAIAKNEADLRKGIFHYYDFSARSFGLGAGYELDFPHMAYSSSYLFVTTNVYLAGNYKYTVCSRLPLSKLYSGSGFSFSYYRAVARTWRLAFGNSTTRYWWQHVTNSKIRLYRWADTSSSILWTDINIGSWTWGTRGKMIAKGPKGRNFMARADSRPLGAWVANGVVGVLWHAQQGGSYKYPYTRIVEVYTSTLKLRRQSTVYSSLGAYAYPCASTNARGHVGGSFCFGGPKYYPGTAAYIVDDLSPNFQSVPSIWIASGNDSPSRLAWGDYLTTIPHSRMVNTWVGTAMSQISGSANSNQIPRYVHFGRSRDRVIRPDLVGVSVSASSTTLYQGLTYTLKSTIRNEGTTTSVANTSGYFISSNSVISSFDLLVGSFTTPSLGISMVHNHSMSARIPSNTTPGSRYLGVLADRLYKVSEWSEANNYATMRVTVRGRPDLSVNYMYSTPTTVTAGNTVKVTTRTINSGTATAASSYTAIVLSTNSLITTFDTPIAYYPTGTLAPNTYRLISLSARIPYCTTTNYYYLGAIADVSRLVTESSESNNSRLGYRTRVLGYSGSSRLLEFRGSYRAPNNYSSYQYISAKAGGNLQMCVTSPRYRGYWYLLVWSGRATSFQLDGLSNFSLSLVNTPIFTGWLGKTNSSGYGYPSFTIPRNTVLSTPFNAYTYSFWFTPTFSSFIGLGGNNIRTYVMK